MLVWARIPFSLIPLSPSRSQQNYLQTQMNYFFGLGLLVALFILTDFTLSLLFLLTGLLLLEGLLFFRLTGLLDREADLEGDLDLEASFFLPARTGDLDLDLEREGERE